MRTELTAVPRNSWWAQALQNRLIALVLAMVVIVPLIASPADSSLAGVAALSMQAFAILLMATLLWRTRWNLSRERVLNFLRTGANVPVLLFFALAVVSCALSPNKAFSIQETAKLGAGVLLYFVVAYQFRQSKHLFMLVDTLLFLGICVALVGMAQYQLNPDYRTSAMFGNAQLLGSLLMILLPMVAVIAITDKTPKRQLAAQFATVLMVGSILLTQTRSAWIGATAGLMVLGMLALLSAVKQGKRNLASQKHKMVLPLMLIVVSAGFFGLMSVQNRSIVERAGTLSTALENGALTARQQQWDGTVAMIKERPLTGWGVGLYPLYQEQYTSQGFTGAQIASGSFRPSLGEQAHNFYLQTAAELGLPGLLLMLGILGSFLMAGLARVDKMDSGIRHSLLMGSIASIAAFALDAVTSPSWQLAQTSMFFWLVLGVGVSCIRPRVKQEEAASVVTFSPRVAWPLAFGVAAVSLMAVLPTYPLAAKPCYKEERKECKRAFKEAKKECKPFCQAACGGDKECEKECRQGCKDEAKHEFEACKTQFSCK